MKKHRHGRENELLFFCDVFLFLFQRFLISLFIFLCLSLLHLCISLFTFSLSLLLFFALISFFSPLVVSSFIYSISSSNLPHLPPGLSPLHISFFFLSTLMTCLDLFSHAFSLMTPLVLVPDL